MAAKCERKVNKEGESDSSGLVATGRSVHFSFEALTTNALGSIQCHACRACFGDEFVVLIANLPFHAAKGLSSVYDLRFGCEFGVPHRPEKVDFELERRERFVITESACECHSHGGIGHVTKNSSMERSHRICM